MQKWTGSDCVIVLLVIAVDLFFFFSYTLLTTVECDEKQKEKLNHSAIIILTEYFIIF